MDPRSIWGRQPNRFAFGDSNTDESCALATHAAGAVQGTAGSFSGYLTVWTVCGLTALVAAIALLFVPKTAFGDPPVASLTHPR